jgi:hypothetical protein
MEQSKNEIIQNGAKKSKEELDVYTTSLENLKNSIGWAQEGFLHVIFQKIILPGISNGRWIFKFATFPTESLDSFMKKYYPELVLSHTFQYTSNDGFAHDSQLSFSSKQK